MSVGVGMREGRGDCVIDWCCVCVQLEGNATGPPDQQREDPASESRGGTKSHRRSNSYTYTTLEVGVVWAGPRTSLFTGGGCDVGWTLD